MKFFSTNQKQNAINNKEKEEINLNSIGGSSITFNNKKSILTIKIINMLIYINIILLLIIEFFFIIFIYTYNIWN